MKPQNNKIPTQAILALKEALTVLFWKKDDLKDFIKLTIERHSIIAVINWNCTKRQSVKELIDRMTSSQDIYKKDLVSLIQAVSEFTEFPHLQFWDDDGSKTAQARTAVENLKKQCKKLTRPTKEQEDIIKRRQAAEKRIAKSKSLEAELHQLKIKFQKIAINTNKQRRGFDLEPFLKELFQLFELNPRGSFKIYGEQIDGAFTYDGTDYLLEAKWKDQVGRGELATFCYKVESKLKATMGLFVTIDGLTPQAISPHFKSVIIMDGADINAVVEGRVTLPDLLYKKRRKATETGNIYIRFTDL